MGTLGKYLHDARVARGIDLRDAAQQTRIGFQYLKALEQEDFTKLPGEVFVKGFLKNYSRFLSLDEVEVLKKYAELKPQPAAPPSAAASAALSAAPGEGQNRKATPLEPFIWGAAIVILLFVFLMAYPPQRPSKNGGQQAGSHEQALLSRETPSVPVSKPEKIFLEVVANEDTWILVRTDDSPQKKAVLKKGERLTWSADERFVLSYGRVGAVQLLLGGAELAVNGAKETVVRDLAVTRAGILNQPAPVKPARPMKPKTQPSEPAQQPQPQPALPQTGSDAVSPAAAQPPAQPSPAPSQPAQAEPAPTAPVKPAE